MPKTPIDELFKEIGDKPIQFGLVAQGHIPTIESLLSTGTSWTSIASEIGWEHKTLQDHFHTYLKSLSPDEIRQTLLRIGFESEDRYGNDSSTKFTYSIWFKRWKWHDLMTGSSVTFHRHITDPTKVHETIYKAARLAIYAYQEFHDHIPRQAPDGSVEIAIGIPVFKISDPKPRKIWNQTDNLQQPPTSYAPKIEPCKIYMGCEGPSQEFYPCTHCRYQNNYPDCENYRNSHDLLQTSKLGQYINLPQNSPTETPKE